VRHSGSARLRPVRRTWRGPGPAALATDAIALLDHLGIARAALVAQRWRLGGCPGAVRAPERFWAIVLGTRSAIVTNPEIAALRQRLTAASPPRQPVLWHAALVKRFRVRSRSSPSSTPRLPGRMRRCPRIFREQLGRTSPLP